MIKYRTLFLLTMVLTALLFSGSSKTGARARLTCQDQCQQQYNQCLSFGIDYYTCSQQRNYCLYHCQ
jgi:hypothetical protein